MSVIGEKYTKRLDFVNNVMKPDMPSTVAASE